MKIVGKRHTYMSVRVSIEEEQFNSLQNFFELNPKIKKAHWFGEAIEQKLKQEYSSFSVTHTQRHGKTLP